MNARAFTARGRWFTDGPDFVDVACSHCKHLVESVDSRGECDDCAADALRAEAREVAAVDQRTALVVGAFAFARRAAAQLVADLAADEGFSSWLDARQADADAMQAAEVDAPRACAECGGHGVVASGRMSNEADCDLDDCRACDGSGLADSVAALRAA